MNVGVPVLRKAPHARLHVRVHKARTLTGDRCVCTWMKPRPHQTVRACPPPGHSHVHARPTCLPSHLHRARWHTLVGASIACALASSHGYVHACRQVCYSIKRGATEQQLSNGPACVSVGAARSRVDERRVRHEPTPWYKSPLSRQAHKI